MLGSATLIVFSLSISATREAADDLGEEGWAVDLFGDVLPFVFTVGVVLFLYRVLPSPRPRTREIWPGAVVAAALISITRGALEIYFEYLSDFGALYGSLGALMALFIFVYAVSLILVFGAEYASEWSRLPEDDARRASRGAKQGLKDPGAAAEEVSEPTQPPLGLTSPQ